jgi:hypothetical protein
VGKTEDSGELKPQTNPKVLDKAQMLVGAESVLVEVWGDPKMNQQS